MQRCLPEAEKLAHDLLPRVVDQQAGSALQAGRHEHRRAFDRRFTSLH
jgi:hypothetical protein